MSNQATTRSHLPRIAMCGLAALVACAFTLALSVSNARATYGDEYGLAAAEGPALPGPSSFWVGACNLDEAPAVEAPIPGGVGSREPQVTRKFRFFGAEFGPAPATPEDCLDLGVATTHITDLSPWATPPSWRLAPVSQAGAHPDLTTTFTPSRDYKDQSGLPLGDGAMPSGSTRDVQVALPPGLVGSVATVPACPNADFAKHPSACPPRTQVGVVNIKTNLSIGITDQVLPVYNLEVLPGHAAEFGIPDADSLTTIRIVARDRTDGDFGISAGVERIPTAAPLLSQSLTFWGVPWAASHDIYRPRAGVSSEITESGLEPALQAHYERSWGPIEPFLTMPSTCTASGGEGPLVSFAADSWQHPAATLPDGEPDLTPNAEEPLDDWVTATSALAPLRGCERLGFEPAISFQPTTGAAESPTGLNVDLSIPQNDTPPAGVASNPSDSEGAPAYWKSEAGLASSDMKDITVTLPEGLTVNPSSAAGLASCSEAQIGLTSVSPVRFDNATPACPEASKLGTAEVDSPLLPEPLTGVVYLASQDQNPFGSLVALYLVVQDQQRGLIVKLAGEAALNPSTGRVTASFLDDPQLPFEDVKLVFKRGSRAPLATPRSCGTYTTSSDMVPWATPAVPDANPTSSFQVDEGCGTGGFKPGFIAGTSSASADGYSPLVVSFSRNDGEQDLGGVSVTLPPGLLGMISHVSQCGEPQASQGTCPASSRIGHTTVTAGAGTTPLSLPEAGQPEDPVFLTGPYEGAPFGLSILVHAQAGPFDLGNVIVRAAIHVNPQTAQVSVTSDELPHILDGVPLKIRSATVNVDRSQFTVNPTSCAPQQITGTIGSIQGASAPVSSSFTAVNCAKLAFAPVFTASTSAKTSRRRGASLNVRIAYPAGEEANIARAKVQLPIRLPSRLATLQKACTEAQFDANPAGCPAASVVGTAKALTPILASPLQGPAYFVSHGGAKFPELIMVLQGEGVTIQLAGETFIGKGITTSTFDQVPDAPISSFELRLPEGEDSALAAPAGHLCQHKLIMPTTLTGQNGKVLEQRTRIQVQGCPDQIEVVSSKLKRRSVTLKVAVPAAGKLVASGKGLARKARTARGAETLTLKLRERSALARKTKISLTFTPKAGKQRKKLKASVTVKRKR